MPEEYVIKVTKRDKDSLRHPSLQSFLVKAEAAGAPYWTHTISNIIEQIYEQNNWEDSEAKEEEVEQQGLVLQDREQELPIHSQNRNHD